jgi:macrolide-specific efflux system membrane fusion protein
MSNSPNSSLFQRLKSSRPATLGVLAVVLAALVWLGFHFFGKGGDENDQYIFASVQQGDIEDLVTATGTLEPRDYVDVGAQVSGQVQQIHVDVGDVVKEGELLIEIDATQSVARVEANRANLRAQESQMAERQNALAKAERDYQRQQNLMKDDATTLEQVQNAETALTTARQAISTLRAQIQQQEATMRVEEANLKYTKIIAPISGTVVSISARLGQTLNSVQQAPTLLRIANLNVMTVKTQVSEADVAKLNNGMRAYFTTLGSQGRRWYGALKRIEPTPTVQNQVVLYNALFDVENDGGSLLPSMTAQVFFVRAEARGVLVVPMAALQQGQQLANPQRKGQAQDAKPAANAAPAGAGQNAATAPSGGGQGAGPGQGAGSPGGQRPGGFGGFNNGQPPTPEQIEQFRRMREQRMAQRGNGEGGAGGAQRSAQRRGTVMVKLANGELEPREVVVGVTDRVRGEVLSGLKEGEEVVAGRPEEEAAAATTGGQQQQNRPGGFQGPGGFPGGGFRPF